MASVTFDLERGHSLSEVLGATEIRRVVWVSDLVAAPEGQLLEAVRDPAVPKLGDLYPGETAWFVTQVDAEPHGVNAARITLTYSNKQGPTWNQPPPVGNDGSEVKQVSSSVRTRRRTSDRASSPMTLTAPASVAGWPDYQSEADVQEPVGDLVFERTETSPPLGRLRGLIRHTNSLPIGAYGANELLFVRYRAQSDDGGRTWRVVYEFAYDENLHRHIDSYHGPDGKVPVDAIETTWDIYPTADYSTFGLDFSDSQTPI